MLAEMRCVEGIRLSEFLSRTACCYRREPCDISEIPSVQRRGQRHAAARYKRFRTANQLLPEPNVVPRIEPIGYSSAGIGPRLHSHSYAIFLPSSVFCA